MDEIDISQANILVVDDNKAVTMLTKHILKDHNFSFVETSNEPLIALELCQERQFDLILLDIMMPLCDGIEFLKKLNEMPNRLPIVLILSALDDKETRLQTLNLGAMDYINKPFDKLELVFRIKNLLNLRFMEKMLSQSEKLLALGAFVSEVANDLNQPLVEIVGVSQNLLKHSKEIPPEMVDDLTTLEKHAQKISTVVNELIKYSSRLSV